MSTIIKTCSKCKIEKNIIFFSKNKSTFDGFQYYCKECIKQNRIKNSEYIKKRDRLYYINNKEKILNSNKKWALENKESSNNIKKKYYINNRIKIFNKLKDRRKNNILLSLIHRLRSRTNYIFRKKGYEKNSETEKLLGIEYNVFIEYFENLFKDGMSWENRNLWHIDHIIPLSSAKTEEELIKLCHYTNLQPLWAFDNLTKSNKIL